MKKALNFLLLWLALLLAFQAFACKSVQKCDKEEPGEAVVTMSQTNTMVTGTGNAKAGGTGTVKAKAGSTGTVKAKAKTGNTGTVKAKAGSTETAKKKAGGTETGKSKQGTLVESVESELVELKEEVIAGAEKIFNPTFREAVLPSGVGLLILISLLSSKKDKRKDE